MEDISDKEFIRLVRSPRTRETGFRKLYDRYHRELYWYIRKMVWTHENADDVLQNAWVKIFDHLEGFRGESSLKTWIYRIVHNEGLQFLRRNKRQVTVGAEELRDFNLTADPWFNGEIIHAILLKAIAGLPERQRQVFELKYFTDLKYQEIAAILDVTEGGLKASYHHAVTKITQYVIENSEEL